MHRSALLLACLVLAFSPAAQAAPLSLEGSSLRFELGTLPAITIAQGAATTVTVSSGGGGFVMPASVFAGSGSVPSSLLTGVPLIRTLFVTLTNQAATFGPGSGPGGGFGGTGPLRGQLIIDGGGFVNLTVPLSVLGAGGVSTGGAAALQVSVTGHAWTTLSGYDDRTAGHAGTLQLVTPFRFTTNATGAFPSFVTKTLVFVPEAGPALLFAVAAAGLALGLRRSTGRAGRAAPRRDPPSAR